MSTGAATVPQVSKEQSEWLGKLVNARPAENIAEQAKVFKGSNARLGEKLNTIRDGMSFTMERNDDPQFIAAMKQALGIKPGQMKSLTGTGNAMKEIDTFEDSPKLKGISGTDLKKAYEALEIVSKESEEARLALREMRLKEAKFDDKDKRAKIEQAVKDRKEAREQKKAVPRIPDGLTEEEIKKFEDVEARVNADVAEEIWTPLVRQGIMPENLVPENYSSVRRTFEAASKNYQERLAEYSKDLDDNDELVKRLGVAQDILDKVADGAKAIAGAVPGGKEVQTALDVFKVVNAAAFKSAQMGVQEKKWYEIAETGANGLADACAKAIPDAGIATIVSSAIKGGVAGGKIALAIKKKDPEAVIKAFSDAVSNGFSIAGSATGDSSWDTYGKIATNALLQGSAGAKLFKAVKEGKGVEDAFNEFLDQSATAINAALAPVIKATISDQQQATNVTQGLSVTTGLASGLGKMAFAEDKEAAFNSAVGATVKSCCENWITPSDVGKTVGALVETGVTNALSARKQLTQGDINGLAQTLMKTAAASLVQAASSPALTGNTEDFKKAAQDLKLEQQANAFAEAIVTRDKSKMASAAKEFFSAMGDAVAKHAPGVSGASGDSGGDDSGGDGDAKKAKELDEKVVESLRSVIEKGQDVLKDKNASEQEKAKAKEAMAKATKELVERKTMESDLAAEGKAFAAKLSRTFEGNDDPDFEGEDTRTLQELILEIQKDRKVFELVDKLSSLPLQIAAKFFPPAGAAMDFKTFSFEVMKSVTHTKQLLQWMDNAGDARNAVSVQAHAMLSRVHCENRQLLEHSMRAALALTAALGQVLAVAGATAAPAGVAMAAAAHAGQATLEIVKTVADEVEIQKAWSLYQEAIREPRNRKKVRQAIQSNPTLAKYALAWGALQGGDPIAKNAMKKCGLSDAILARESANVKEVQQYLEELFNEDVVVLRAIPVKKGWYPDTSPKLTLRSWSAFYAAAVEKAKLKPGTGGAVGKAFTDLELCEINFRSAEAEIKRARQVREREEIEAKEAAAQFVAKQMKAKDLEVDAKAPEIKAPPPSPTLKKAQDREATAQKSLQTTREGLLKGLEGVKSAALAFAPKDTDGKDHVDMREYLDALAAQSELRVREL
jgi:hypothetical protein